MKIYRYIPNTINHGVITKPIDQKWWPLGIDLGHQMDHLYEGLSDNTSPNTLKHYPFDEHQLPLSDFPALALNLPLVSARAVEALKRHGVEGNYQQVEVGDQLFYAVQTYTNDELFDWDQSDSVNVGNIPLFFHKRVFNTDAITGEFFTLPDFAFSDVYITEKLLQICEQEKLTGLEQVELVYGESGPVIPHYVQESEPNLQSLNPRAQLEMEIIEWRCSYYCVLKQEMDKFLVSISKKGYIDFSD